MTSVAGGPHHQPFRIGLAWLSQSRYGEDAIRGVAEYARRFGVFQFFLNQSGDIDFAQIEKRHDIQGILFYRLYHDDPGHSMKWPAGIPVISLEQSISTVTGWQALPDDQAVGKMVAEELLRRQFKRLAYCPLESMHPSAKTRGWDRDRFAAFSAAVGAAGATLLVYDHEPAGWRSGEEEWKGPLADWLKSLPKPVGVMAANDRRARHLMLAAEQIAVRIPEEVAIIGVDNEAWGEIAFGGLSSVELDGYTAGYTAAGVLHQILAGQLASPQRERIAPRQLITRRSSDAFAIDDSEVVAAMHFIAEHAADGIHVDQVVEAALLSRRALERRFRRALRRSILDEIRSVQTERAKMLMGDSALSLQRVAQLAGFRSAKAMIPIFRRFAGKTPSEYRNSLDSGGGGFPRS